MNNTIRIFLPLFLFAISIPFIAAQTPDQTQLDPTLEEAMNDAEFLQFLKRSGQSLGALQELKKQDSNAVPKEENITPQSTPNGNIVSNETKISELDILSHKNRLLITGLLENLQDCTTPGFKERKYEHGFFSENPQEMNLITKIDFRPGPMIPTQRELDVAIEGDGFFCVTQSSGPDETSEPNDFYTRYGSLERSVDGNLAVIFGTQNFPLEPKIAIPEDWEALEITPQGEVWITPIQANNTASEKRKAGQIILVRFSNPSRLHPENAVLFSATPLSGKAITARPDSVKTGKIRQNALEQSNTTPEKILKEMERLIEVSRIIKQL